MGLYDGRSAITLVRVRPCVHVICSYIRQSFIIFRIGPEKGVIHIASGAVNNALWDMYARSRRKPLWKLVVDFTPVRIFNLNLSFLLIFFF